MLSNIVILNLMQISLSGLFAFSHRVRMRSYVMQYISWDM